VIGAAIFGPLGGSFVLTETDNGPAHDKNAAAHIQSGNSWSEKDEIGAALYAGGMAIAGGVVGFLVVIDNKRAKRYAYKRAKKIVDSTL
jgi:hypothetical protein